MVMEQCTHCKNSNPQCRQSFVLYNQALYSVTKVVNNGNQKNKFFKEKEDKREYGFNIECNKFEDCERKEVKSKKSIKFEPHYFIEDKEVTEEEFENYD